MSRLYSLLPPELSTELSLREIPYVFWKFWGLGFFTLLIIGKLKISLLIGQIRETTKA
jgi:hypothetical protein